MGNLIPSNNNDDNLDFNPTKLPGCKVWIDATDESTLFTTDYQGSVTVPDNFTPTSVGGCSTWYDSSDASTLYNTSAGPVTAVSSPTEVSGCALWLDAADNTSIYKTNVGPLSPVSAPTDIGGCQFWLDASDPASMFEDTAGLTPSSVGNTVGLWRDKSGNARHVQQATGSKKPIRSTSVFSSGAVHFDGIDDILSNQTASEWGWATGGSMTWIFVGQRGDTPSVSSDYRYWFGNGEPLYQSNINSFGIFVEDQNPHNGRLQFVISQGGAHNKQNVTFDTNSSPDATIWLHTLAYEASTPSVFMRGQGSDRTITTVNTNVATSGVSPNFGLSVGADSHNSYAGSRFGDIRLAEVCAFNRRLTNDEIYRVEKYLADKWNISDVNGTVTNSGDTIGAWRDKSGNGFHATQLNNNQRPSRNINPQNNLQGLQFSNANSTLLTTQISGSLTSSTQDYTVFLVCQRTAVHDGEVILGRRTPGCYASALYYNNPGANSTNIQFYNSGPEIAFPTEVGIPTSVQMICLSRSGSTNYSGWQAGLSSFIDSSMGSGPASSLLSNIGASCNGSSGMTGYIYEILAYNRNLTREERASVEKYLANKWNTTDNHVATTANSKVGYWADKTGNNRHARQDVSSYRPSYSGSINDLPAITFDGADDHFLIGNLSAVFPTFGEVFIVFEPDNTVSYSLYQTKVNYAYFTYDGSSNFGYFTNNKSATFTWDRPRTGTNITSVRSASGTLFVRLNGNHIYSQSGLGHDGGNNHAIGFTYSGGGGVSGVVMKGKIVEVITFNTDIGTENRARVEQYLSKKWGMQTTLHDKSSQPGEKIGYWKNKTDLNFALSQYRIEKQGEIGFINGKRAVSFENNSGFLLAYLANTVPGEELSFFWVCNITKPGVNNQVVFRFGNYSGYTQIAKFDDRIEYGGTNGITINNPPQTKNLPIIESVIKSNGTIWNSTNVYRNGILLPKNNLGVDGNLSTGSNDVLIIAGYSSDANFLGTGGMIIGEFICYNRAVSDQERKLVEKYLHDKWNINKLTTSISKPTDISRCSMWLDANDPKTLFVDTAASTNVSADGQTIAYWADKVSGQDVIQATVSARPTYRTNMQNGRPMLYFDGGDDLLSQVNRPYAAPCTLFVVCRIDSHSGDVSGIVTHGDSTGGLNGPGFCYIGSTAAGACLVFLDGAGAGTTSSSNTNSSMLGLPRVITGVYNQSNTSNSLIYVNGNLEENFTGTGVTLNAAANRVQIGARTGGGQTARRMIGYVAECIRYDRVLTDNERAMVENYLSEKWGLGSYSSPNSIGSSIVRHNIKVSNKDAQNWVDRVFQNGGSVSERTADRVNSLCNRIDAAGIRKKFYRVNLFCGNDLAACLTPLYLGPDNNTFYGSRTDTNNGFVGPNYDEKNGLISTAQGNHLLTGVSFDAIGASDFGHMAFYQTQYNIDTNEYAGGNRVVMGGGSISIAFFDTTDGHYLGSNYGPFVPTRSSYFGGLFVSNRSSATNFKSYEQGSTVSQNSLNMLYQTPQTSQIGIFTNGSVGASGFTYISGYLKGYSFGHSMSDAEVSTYSSIMEDFQTSLGRGLPIRPSAQFASVTNSEAKSWIDAVYTNNGTVSISTALAVNNFCNSIDAAGLRNKFYRLNLFCGNTINSCLVPLYRAPARLGPRYGNQNDINIPISYGYYVNSDDFNYIENQGLLGNTQEIAGNSNISRRYLDTGLITGSISQLNNDMHYAIYSKDLTSGGYAMGAYDGASTGFSLQIGLAGYNVGAFANARLNQTNTSTTAIYPTRKGLYVGNYSNYILNLYEGRANVVGQRDLTFANALNPTTVSTVSIFAENRVGNGIALFNYLDRLQGYSIGTSLTSADVQNYYDIMQTFQAALSRAQQTTLSSTFDSITNADARDWLTRVYENGGTVSLSTATAVQNFCNTIDSAGLRSRFFRLNLFCGDNLNAATVPLYRGQGVSSTQHGFLIDINTNFTSSDYNQSGSFAGIKGNGSNKRLDTGLGTDYTNNSSISFGAFISEPTSKAFSTYLGVAQNTNADTTVLYYRDGFTRGLDGATYYPAEPTNSTLFGYHVYSRTAGNNFFHSWNGISGSSSNSVSAARGSDGFVIHALNNNGTLANYGDGRISMYHIGLGLTSAETVTLYNAIDAFNTSMGRTRPSASFASVTNEDAKIWVDNVYYNGGTVSSTTANLLNTFCNSIDSAGLRGKIYRLNLMCGNNVNAASVPLYKGIDRTIQYGSLIDANNNFTSSDYVETGVGAGLRGDGSTKFLNTGLAPNKLPDNLRTGHIGIYMTKSSQSNNRRLIGTTNDLNNDRFQINHAVLSNTMSAVFSGSGGGGTIISYKNNAQELYVVNRNANNSARFYTGGVGGVVTTTNISGQLSDTNPNSFVILATNSSAGVSSHSDATVAGYTIGLPLTDSEHNVLYQIIETFNLGLNRGRSSTGFAGIDNEDAKIWIDTVYSKGGSASSSTANLVNTFCNSIDAAGLRNKFYRVNLFCGNGLESCLTPIYCSQTTSGIRYGGVEDTNNNFVSADYSENSGLIGNASNKWLDTMLPQNFATYRHLGVVMNKLPSAPYRMIMGAKTNAATLDWTSDTRLQTDVGTNVASFWTGNASGQLSTGISMLMTEKTFVIGLTDSDGLNKLYSDTLTTNSVNTISAPDTTSIGIFAQKIGATSVGSTHTDARLSLYTIGINLTSSEIATLTSIIDAFNDGLARGKPSNTFASVTNNDAKLWINRVYTNGGSISSNTASSVNSFCNSINANGLRDKFYRLNLFCGNNLVSALTPLYLGPSATVLYGSHIDINNNFIASDYSETSGLQGSFSGNKYLLTNLAQSVLTTNNRHLSAYETVKNTRGYGALIGSDNGASNVSSWSISANGEASSMGYYSGAGNDYVWGTSYTPPTFWLGTGSSTQGRIYKNGIFDVDGSTVVTPGTPGSSTIGIFNKNSSTHGPGVLTNAAIGMYSVGLSFTDAEIISLNQILNAFNSNILRA